MKNLAILLNYPLSNNRRVGNLGALAKQFREARSVFDEVHVLSPRDSEEYHLGKGVFVHAYGPTNRVLYYLSPLWDFWNLLHVVREKNVAVIRALAPTSGLIAVLVGKLTRTPVIVSVHADQRISRTDEKRSALKNFLIGIVEPFVLRNADNVPVISEHIRRYALEHGARPETLVFHPNFVDTRAFRPRPKRGREKRILFVGRLSKVKGAEEAIRAMAAVVREFPNAALEIAGTGEEEAALRRLVRDLRLDKNVRFLGAVEHEKALPELMGRADVFVAPVTAGFSLMEAMSSGLAVVAGDIEWTREVVRDGETGVLVKAGDANAVAQGLLRVLRDARLARKMGASARRVAVERFSWEAWQERERGVYRRALALVSRT